MTCRAARIGLVILLACAVSPAWALDGAKVRDLVQAALTAAGRPGQPVVSANRGFPPCDTNPTVSPTGTGWHAVRLSCDTPQPWHRMIRVQGGTALPLRHAAPHPPPQDRQSVLVLTESLRRGTVLGPAHLKRADMTATTPETRILTPEQAIGRRLKQDLGAGRPLLARHLEHDWLVQQNDPVTITTTVGAIRIDASGVALEQGQLGQAIRVINPSSGRTIHAIVTGANKVALRPNMR